MAGDDAVGAGFVAGPCSGPAPGRAVRIYADAPDEQLLSWSAGGDRRAFDQIVVRHGPFALRVASRLVADRSLAEDLAQEAFVRAWTQARHFDPQRARFTTWLYRIVTNLCIDQRRRMRPQPFPKGFDAVDPAAGAQELMEHSEQARVLSQALGELPVRQRAAMTLVYDEGMSGPQAAQILGVSTKAIERLLARAREHLRARLVSRGKEVDT